MNLILALQRLCPATLAITLGIIVCPDSAKASQGFNQDNLDISKPTLLVESGEAIVKISEGKPQAKKSFIQSEKSPAFVIAAQKNTEIINQNQPEATPISVNVDSQTNLEKESISIPVAIENNNQPANNSINIPVVPAATDNVVVQQNASNPVMTLENVDSYNNTPQENNSISIQIEYYDPTTSPSVDKLISPNLPDAPGSFKGYIWPAKGVLTSGYGWRWGRMHRGIDIAAPIGTPIIAAADGQVIFSGWNSGGYGNLVKIKHLDGSMTLYAHNSKNLIRNGEWVQQGQEIAKMGSTGRSTGSHLHFEIHPKGQGAVNPVAFLPKRVVLNK